MMPMAQMPRRDRRHEGLRGLVQPTFLPQRTLIAFRTDDVGRPPAARTGRRAGRDDAANDNKQDGDKPGLLSAHCVLSRHRITLQPDDAMLDASSCALGTPAKPSRGVITACPGVTAALTRTAQPLPSPVIVTR